MSSRLEFPVVENFSPEITVELIGLGGDYKLIAIVDTGFTGFMQVPLAEGIKAHLNLWGIRPAKLADGSIVKSLECFGKVRFANKELFGLISLSEGGEDCLLGMQFLEQLKMDFTVSPTTNKAIFSDSGNNDTSNDTLTENNQKQKIKKGVK